MQFKALVSVLILATTAQTASAQQTGIATPGTILAVLDGMADLRRMVSDCAPERAPQDEAASWTDLRDRVSLALQSAGMDADFVAKALARLDAPGTDVDCDLAMRVLAVFPERPVDNFAWDMLVRRSFDAMGVPLPETIPDRSRWDAISAVVIREAEAMRQPMACVAVMRPWDVVILSLALGRNNDELAQVLTDAGFPPADIAALMAATGPDSLLPTPDTDRAALMADCIPSEDEWMLVLRRGVPPAARDAVMQILGTP